MYKIIKRFFDIFFSFLLLLISFPVLFIIILILKFSDEGEVFYFQKRLGINNSEFMIWKFATMLKNSINMGTGSITLRDDFRVTKFGKILRKTKLNEILQIINILIGDISFVGPRPLVYQTFKSYPSYVQSKIYKIKPGLTGLGSIVFRDEEKFISESNLDPHIYYKKNIAPVKGTLELWYQENQSFFVDFKLLICTVIIVLFPNSNPLIYLFKNLPNSKFIKGI